MNGNESKWEERPVLGIDPGYERMGYAVCVQKSIKGLQLIEAGILETSAGELFSKRLLKLSTGLAELLDRYAIREAAVEKLFFSPAWKSAVKVAEARGVVLMELARANVQIFEYAPTEVKRAITGNGRSVKKAVEAMVMKLCGLRTPLREDNAADAVAIAIAHLFQNEQHPITQTEISRQT